MPEANKHEPQLKRSLGFVLITLYGLGTTVGAGIYVLIGKVGERAGLFAPWSFLLASLMAAFTAFTFAELASRHPKSAGEAVYAMEAFGSRALATGIGLCVALAAVVSAATMARGFAGYMGVLVAWPSPLAAALLVISLGAVAAWGIRESVAVAALFTLLEVGGLLAVIGAGTDALATLPQRLPELVPPLEAVPALGILSGAVLAFYAFLGFEDMVNVAEEVRNVRRNLPRAIAATLALTILLYGLVSLVAVLTLPPAELARSDAPLALLFTRQTGAPPEVMGVVAALAMVNGGLIQIILASRMLYGLGRAGWLPAALGRVHRRTATPLLTTALATAAILALALGLPLVALAEATSFLMLVIFAVLNLALIRLKRRAPRPEGVVTVPLAVPVAGFLVSAGFVAFQLARAFFG